MDMVHATTHQAVALVTITLQLQTAPAVQTIILMIIAQHVCHKQFDM